METYVHAEVVMCMLKGCNHYYKKKINQQSKKKI